MGYPCMKCKKMFMSDKGRAKHDCGKVREAKPPKINHNRGKPKRRNVTAVTDKVRKELDRRAMEIWESPVACCERCGRHNRTAAHMEAAGQMGPGNVPWNVVNLCGTHGTKECHDWADNTREGMDWKKAKAAELYEYYHDGEGQHHWKT